MEQAVSLYLSEAKANLSSNNYGRAYAFFLLVLKLNPNVKRGIKDDFGKAWEAWSQELLQLNRAQDLFSMYEQGCEAFMDSEALHLNMGCCLYHLEMKFEAVGMFRRTLLLNENSHEALVNMENACRGLVDSWHFAMLNDLKRNDTFNNAIRDALNSIDWDNCILDIGSGTGLLGMFAVKNGAAKVHCCEISEVMHSVAEECIEVNDMEPQIVPIHSDSTKLSVASGTSTNSKGFLPERATLVISEIVDAGLFGEGIVDAVNHAWKNLLLPPTDGGMVIPHSASVYCALVECDALRNKHNTTEMPFLQNVLITSGVGHDVGKSKSEEDANRCQSFMKCTCESEPYSSERIKNFSHKVMSEPCKLLDINFNDPDLLENIATGHHLPLSIDFHNLQKGKVDALVMWFHLNLDADKKHVINTEIASEFCWDQAVYPIRSYVIVDTEDSGSNVNLQRLSIQESDILRLHFTAHVDRLQLESIDKLSFDKQCSKSYSQILSNVLLKEKPYNQDFVHVTLPEVQVMRCNDTVYSNMYFKAICQYATHKEVSVLDISNGFDLNAFKLCKTLSGKITVAKHCQSKQIREAYEHIAVRNNMNNITFTDASTTVARNVKFDIVLSDLIEPSGLISPNALVSLAEAKSFLKSEGFVVPKEISVNVCCISSTELLQKCMVTSDENTLDLKIAQSINHFRVSVHSDLDMHTLDYTRLTGAEEGLKLNLNQHFDTENIKHSIVCKVNASGIVHAILFWFSINICDNECIDTSNPKNHWLQAAYVLPKNKQLTVNEGDELVVSTTLYNDSLLFTVSSYG